MRILVAAHETGCANALVPVIRRLKSRSDIHVEVRATGYAPRVFQEEGISYQPMDLAQEGGGLNAADRLLQEQQPDLLLLGTAWEKTIENALLQRAQVRGIRSLSIVDNWSYFRKRFRAFEGDGLLLPDRVIVVDEIARDRAIAEGLPADRLVITGQPHLESIPQRAREPDVARQADHLRSRWTNGRSVLFVSEPFYVYSPPSTADYRGYTEVEAFEGLMEAADKVRQKWEIPIRVVVRPHPRELDSPFAIGPLIAARGAALEEARAGLAGLLACDAVVGMASMLLLESALAGRPTASFEPNGKKEFSFHGVEIGAVAKTSSVRELADWLETVLTTPKVEPSVALARLAQGNAAHRIVEIALELAHASQETA